MSIDRNPSTPNHGNPQPSQRNQGALSSNPQGSSQEPEYTQLYDDEGGSGKTPSAPQAALEFQLSEPTKEQPDTDAPPPQFYIDPKTHRGLLIAQIVRNILITIPAVITLVAYVYSVVVAIASTNGEYGSLAWGFVLIFTIIAVPYYIYVILQITALKRFRKSVMFRWIRGVNIYSLIIGPIAAAFYVPALIGGLFGSFMIYESSYYYIGPLFTAISTIIAAYELTMCISMIVVMSNSIKKTAQPLTQGQYETPEGNSHE